MKSWVLLSFLLIPLIGAQFPPGGGYVSVQQVQGPLTLDELTEDDEVHPGVLANFTEGGVFYLTHLSHADVSGILPTLNIYATEAFAVNEASGMVRVGVGCTAYYGTTECNDCSLCDAAGRPVSPIEYVPWDLEIFPFSFDCSGIEDEHSCSGIENPRENCHEADECCPKDSSFPTGVRTCFKATPPQPTFAPVVIDPPTTRAPTPEPTMPPTLPGATFSPTVTETDEPTMSPVKGVTMSPTDGGGGGTPTTPGTTPSPTSSTLTTLSPVKEVDSTFAPAPASDAAAIAHPLITRCLTIAVSLAYFVA